MDVVVSLVIAYLLGTFPTAVVVSRIATRGELDIREAGSGNPGAMNTLGVLGAKWGAVVLLGDVGKAVAACVIARAIAGGNAADLAGSAAVVGHCFPVWTGFRRGGKGVAAAGGQCWATFPVYAPIAMVVAIITSRRRFESRALIAASLASAIWVAASILWTGFDIPNAWGPDPSWALIASAVISGFVIAYKFIATRPAPQLSVPAAS